MLLIVDENNVQHSSLSMSAKRMALLLDEVGRTDGGRGASRTAPDRSLPCDEPCPGDDDDNNGDVEFDDGLYRWVEFVVASRYSCREPLPLLRSIIE